jgi:D-3-phosphoglycerate dehydrogenase / 2-oxoglutarate reductase
MTRNVLVTDYTFDDLSVEESILLPLGCKVMAHKCRDADELARIVPDADFILTQFAPVNERVIAAMKPARVIVRYGIGVDNVDLNAARSRGIPVCNVPDYCIDEVADHTLALILACTRQVVGNCLHIRGGKWGLAVPLTGMRALRDLTVGVVGFGRIGREVVRRLLAFKCSVLVFDPVVPAGDIESAGARAAKSLDELLPACDVLTLHCPSTERTRRMINRESLSRLKPGAILINVARGDLADTAAIVEALQTGQLAMAGLDVCDPEPIPPGHALLSQPGVLLSAHVASTSPPAVRKLRETAAGIIARAVRGEVLPNIVNGVMPAI